MYKIKTRYSQFDLISLSETLAEIYELSAPLKCQFYRNGLNDTYKITDANGDIYYLRISLTEVHTTTDIEEEIAVILCCRRGNLNVVEPIACSDEKYVWEVIAPEGKRQAVLFREVINKPAQNPDSETMYRNLGSQIAGIHTVTQSMIKEMHRPLIDKTMLSERPLKLLKPYLHHRMADYDFMKRTNQVLWNYITENLSNDSSFYGVCHGDIQPGNYFFIDEDPFIFDFDCMGYGYYAYDLGVLLGNMTFMDNDIYKKPLWNWILDGYSSVRTLDPRENKSVYAFAALQMMRVLAYHVELTEQDNGVFYYTSDNHLNMFIGAYRRLFEVACTECGLHIS